MKIPVSGHLQRSQLVNRKSFPISPHIGVAPMNAIHICASKELETANKLPLPYCIQWMVTYKEAENLKIMKNEQQYYFCITVPAQLDQYLLSN